MSERKVDTFRVQGLNYATSPHDVGRGAMRLLENLVCVGSEDAPHWTVPRLAEKISLNDILSLGVQRREKIGRFADAELAPDPSIQRLIALRADGIYLIDPGKGFRETQVHSFNTADTSRRAQFTQVQDTTHIAISSGDGVGTPEQSLLLHDDVVAPARWPPFPIITVSYTGVDEQQSLPEGEYVWEFAWQLDDGSLGPAGFIDRTSTGTTGKAGFEVNFTIDRFPQSLSSYWEERLTGLAIIGHAPTKDGSEDVKVSALNDPGSIVAELNNPRRGASASWVGTVEDLQSGRTFPTESGGSAVQYHREIAASNYSYNARLILGDVYTDFRVPALDEIVKWDSGTENAGGNSIWLIMEVEFDTPAGRVTRLTNPIPFDGTNATSVTTRSDLLWHPDVRAARWELYRSLDYRGDVFDATWDRVLAQGTKRSFEESTGGTFVYVEQGTDKIDITKTVTASGEVDVTESDEWEENLDKDEEQETGEGGPLTYKSSVEEGDYEYKISKYSDLDEDNVIADTQEVTAVDVTANIRVVAAAATRNYAFCRGTITVELLDGAGRVATSQQDQQKEVVLQGETGIEATDTSNVLSFSGFDQDTVQFIRVRFEIEISTIDEGSAFDLEADADLSANVLLTVSGGGGVPARKNLTLDTNDEVAEQPGLVRWSTPYKPLERPAEAILSASQRPGERVLAMQATGQTVSEGQFGEFPILVCSSDSVRALKVAPGEDVFVSDVDVLTADQGAVSRGAVTTMDGPVLACLDEGVMLFQANLKQTPVSTALHDTEGQWLGQLGPQTSLAYFRGEDRGRRELWLSTEQADVTWCFSLDHGTWSTLRRARRDYARIGQTVYGIDWPGQLHKEEERTGELTTVRMRTAALKLGPIGQLKRLRRFYLRQLEGLDTWTHSLITEDPENGRVTLDLQQRGASEFDVVSPAAGLGQLFFLDVDAFAYPGEAIEAIELKWDVLQRRIRAEIPHGRPDYDFRAGAPYVTLIDETDRYKTFRFFQQGKPKSVGGIVNYRGKNFVSPLTVIEPIEEHASRTKPESRSEGSFRFNKDDR